MRAEDGFCDWRDKAKLTPSAKYRTHRSLTAGCDSPPMHARRIVRDGSPRTTMKSTMHRRHFLHTGALAIGALCTSFAGTARAAERTAFGFIGKYSDRFLLRGGSAGTTSLVALVHDLPRFCEAMFRARAAGISDLRVAGSRVTFRAGGELFEVENLMQHDFAARLAEQPGDPAALV